MSRRKFVITSTVVMLAAAGVVAGLAYYSNIIVSAAIPDLPRAVRYLPAGLDAVFGMNVREFIQSPLYAELEAKHGDKIDNDLVEFIDKTGVDPRQDLDYLIVGGKNLNGRGSGVVIAVGNFNTAAIESFVHSHGVPIEADYEGAKVLMIPEESGTKLEKGLAFLNSSEIAFGDLESLKAVIDVSNGMEPGIETNTVIAPLLDGLDPSEMLWFAGDASRILTKAPTDTPFGGSIAAIENVVGTLSLREAVTGKITATARDEESATKLADVVKGFVALGQLAAEQNPELGELMQGISVVQEKNQIQLIVNFPYDLLDRLESIKRKFKAIA